MEILKRNWKIKLFSLAIAIFFWSFVIVLENPNVTTRISNIPVVIENMETLDSKGLSIAENFKKTVDISVSGQRNRIINLTPQHIRVTADFSNVVEGSQVIKLKYSLPDEITREEGPDHITVVLEKIISTEFVINVKTKGTVPDNYILESTKTTPEKMTVRGLRSKLQKISNISATLDLSNITKDTIVNQEIKAYTEDGTEITDVKLGQDFVNVSAVIKKTKEVDINLLVVGNLDSNYRLESKNLNRSKVYIAGPEQIIDKIEKIDTHEIDISNLTSSQKIPVKLNLPADVSKLNKDEEFLLELEIQSKTTKNFELSKENIKINNNSSKNYEILNDSIKLQISGFSGDLDKIKNSDIELRLDISNLFIGTYNLEPKIFIDGREIEKDSIKEIEKLKLKITRN